MRSTSNGIRTAAAGTVAVVLALLAAAWVLSGHGWSSAGVPDGTWLRLAQAVGDATALDRLFPAS